MYLRAMFASLSLLTAPIALAGSGSATIPNWVNTTGGVTTLFISNVSESISNIKVKLYDQEGNLYLESTQAGQNITFSGPFVGDPMSSSGATLESQKSGSIQIDTGSGLFIFGYGVVEWTSENEKQSSIIASGLLEYQSGSAFGRANIEINNGRAF